MALIYQDGPTALSGWKAIEKTWGAIDFLSEVRPFDYTHYYEDEMGLPLFRRWATFRELVPQDRLADIKWQALELEKQWTIDEKRRLESRPGTDNGREAGPGHREKLQPSHLSWGKGSSAI